jgi:protein-disulfide isomerase
VSNSLPILAVSVLLACAALPGLAQELTEERVKELVLETIRENPAILLEAMAILEAQEQQAQAAAASAALESEREALESDANAPVMGNPEGDVTVVEFFDYNCPYCRRSMPELTGLLEGDSNVRLVLREWPILSEGSNFAARAALAAREQGQYQQMHEALMALQQPAEEVSVLRVAEELGLDIDQLKADMQSPEIEEHLATSMRLAETLGFSGTPSFVIGDQLIPGYVEQAVLEDAVEQTRAGE